MHGIKYILCIEYKNVNSINVSLHVEAWKFVDFLHIFMVYVSCIVFLNALTSHPFILITQRQKILAKNNYKPVVKINVFEAMFFF